MANFEGPKVFIDRLKRVSTLPENVELCGSALASVTNARRNKYKKKIVARLDGTSYYRFTSENLVNFLIQREKNNTLTRFLASYVPNCLTPMLNRYLDRGAVWLLKNSNGIIFQSELSLRMHKRFLGFDESKIPNTIIFNGADLNEFSPTAKQFKLCGFPSLLVSASTYRLHKRLKDAVLLTNFLSKEFPKVRLHILGNCDFLVRETLKEIDTSRCVFHGMKMQKDLPFFYAGADVQLSLSLWDPCPNVVCEGLAAGLPVITPVESGAFELIGSANRLWSHKESLKLDYYELQTADKIPNISVEPYARIISRVVDDLALEKEKARARACKELDINAISLKYHAFIASIRSQ
jgi:glycosyltransferase involved in cell wall biosynthesis